MGLFNEKNDGWSTSHAIAAVRRLDDRFATLLQSQSSIRTSPKGRFPSCIAAIFLQHNRINWPKIVEHSESPWAAVVDHMNCAVLRHCFRNGL